MDEQTGPGTDGYFSDAYDTILDGLGLSSGGDAVKTISRAVKEHFADGPQPAVPAPAPAPKSTFSALPKSASDLLHNKYFGVSGSVILGVGAAVMLFGWAFSRGRR